MEGSSQRPPSFFQLHSISICHFIRRSTSGRRTAGDTKLRVTKTETSTEATDETSAEATTLATTLAEKRWQQSFQQEANHGKKQGQTEQTWNTTTYHTKPSRWRPGTPPIYGLTERPHRHPHQDSPATFFYYRRAKVRINQKRRERRRQWRFFKRTCLWARATETAKERLQKSSLAKRKCLKQHSFKQSLNHARHWFKSTIKKRKQEF